MLGHGDGMCQDEETGRVRACCRMNQDTERSHQGWTQPHSSLWAGKPALTMATVVLPAGWGCQDHPQLLLWESQEAADCHPLPHAAHASSELGRGCLGVSGRRLQDKAAAGTAQQALQPRGSEGWSPRQGCFGVPLLLGPCWLQLSSLWPLLSPERILPTLHIFGRSQ